MTRTKTLTTTAARTPRVAARLTPSPAKPTELERIASLEKRVHELELSLRNLALWLRLAGYPTQADNTDAFLDRLRMT